MAHEVNQPLSAVLANAIAGLSQLQKDSLDRVELEEILGDIARDAQRGTEIIQKIRDLFRSVAHQKRSVDVNLVIRGALELTRPRIESDSVHVALHLPDDLPSVLGDMTKLRQVMLNLIGNALDAMTGVTGRPRTLEGARSTLGGQRRVHRHIPRLWLRHSVGSARAEFSIRSSRQSRTGWESVFRCAGGPSSRRIRGCCGQCRSRAMASEVRNQTAVVPPRCPFSREA